MGMGMGRAMMEKKTEEEEELIIDNVGLRSSDSEAQSWKGLWKSPGPPNSCDTNEDPKRQNLMLPNLGNLRLTGRKSLPKVSQPKKQQRWAPNPGGLALKPGLHARARTTQHLDEPSQPSRT